VRVDEGGQLRYFFGSDVEQVPQWCRDAPTTKVYRNWKPLFFSPTKGEHIAIASHDGDAGHNSASAVAGVATLERQYRDWIADHFRTGGAAGNIVTFEQWKAVTAPPRRAVASPREVSRPSDRSPGTSEIDSIAQGYFEWLRKFVQSCLGPKDNMNIATIPTRITLPSFANQRDAEDRLVNILRQAGWRCDEHAVVHEPFANALGLFTEGKNHMWSPTGEEPLDLSYVGMFGGTPFFKAMRHFALQGGQGAAAGPSPVYWVLTIDIGGFTTDFSMIGLDVEEMDFLDGHDAIPRRLSKHSVVAGVRHLDDRVQLCLPMEKQECLRDLMNSVNQLPLETFHHTVYKHGAPLTHKGVTVCESDEDRNEIREVVLEFSKQVCTALDEFMTVNGYKSVQEVVLTGGGMCCPTVRDSVMNHANVKYGVTQFSAPLDQDERIHNDRQLQCRRIAPKLVRAATAIGGASVLIDCLNGDQW